MALIMLWNDQIKENPNIFYVLECYFDEVEYVCQQGGRIFMRVQGEGITTKDDFLRVIFDNTDNFTQIIIEK